MNPTGAEDIPTTQAVGDQAIELDDEDAIGDDDSSSDFNSEDGVEMPVSGIVAKPGFII